MKDLYAILETDANGTTMDILEAYGRLYKKFYPELQAHDPYFESRWREIHEAYLVLSNPTKRLAYDTALKKRKASITTVKPRNYTRRGIDYTFTILLMVFTAIFGAYVYRSVYGAKAHKALNTAPQAAAVPVVTPEHYKKRHINKYVQGKPYVLPSARAVATQLPKAINQRVPVTNYIHQATHSDTGLPEAVATNTPGTDDGEQDTPGYLYAAILKANETGVVNLREFASYNAYVIRVIPNNAKVYVLEKGNGYCKIMFDNTIGYVPKWTIQTK